MPQRALSERRPLLLVSIVAAIAWYFLRDGDFGGIWLMLLKGTAVAMLAIYAAVRHNSFDAKILGGVMAASALGDALVELDWLWGAQAFFASHIVAIWLYLRNRRESLSPSQKGTFVALLVGTPLISWMLTFDIGVLVYALVLGAMAACAWGSRFPRYRVGIGAVLFVISDWLIFAKMGWPQMEMAGDLLVWPTYYVGQFLICTGVIQTLRREIS